MFLNAKHDNEAVLFCRILNFNVNSYIGKSRLEESMKMPSIIEIKYLSLKIIFSRADKDRRRRRG